MPDFPMLDPSEAPAASRPQLEAARRKFGAVPNLHLALAASPEALEADRALHALAERSAFTAVERNVLWLAISVEHRCRYCVPAHTGIALAEGVDPGIVRALREEEPLSDPRLEALRAFALGVVRRRGAVSRVTEAIFRAAGYGDRAAFDVVMIVAQKTISNYANRLADAPVDAAALPHAWAPPERGAG